MANFRAVRMMDTINKTDSEKVKALVDSILANGWQGAPILYVEGALITGSHRLEALKTLDRMTHDEIERETLFRINDILESDEIALDVTEIVEAYLAENEMEFWDIQFDSLRSIFEGTEVEQYAEQLVEW